MDPNRTSSPVQQHRAPPTGGPVKETPSENPLDIRATPKPSPKPAPSQPSWVNEPIARQQHAESSSAIRVSPRPSGRPMEPDASLQVLSSVSTPEPDTQWPPTTAPVTSDIITPPPADEKRVVFKRHRERPRDRISRNHRVSRRKREKPSPNVVVSEPHAGLFSREPLDRSRPMWRVRSSNGANYIEGGFKRPRSMSNPETDGPRHPVMLLRKSAMIPRPPPNKRPRMLTPEEVAKKIQDDQLMKEICQRRDEQFIPGPREPPINMQSLKSLDASEILRNPQLRHDLLFDSLAFRPVNAKVPLATQYVGVPTKDKPPVVDPSATCDVSEMYWDCIRAEIETGCRCTRWVNSGDVKVRVENCVCGKWRHELSEAEWWNVTRPTWPSRLPKLIATLRQILESLMASTTPCVNHFAHAASKEMMQRHEAVCPTVTHTLVPELFAALDPDFLTVQARRGVFGVQIFRVLGEAMKVHCAPVRDEMVDDMVATACKPDIVNGLRKAFDCVEVMKLDIANHQVHAVRPMLWTQAEQNEMTTFKNYLASTKRTVLSSKTRLWIRGSSIRALREAEPAERAHLLGKCACHNTEEFLARSLALGFSDLVFSTWIPENHPWPPVVPSRLQVMQLAEQTSPCPVSLPEVLKMDHRRIKNFHCEMVDLAICQIIANAYLTVLRQHHRVNDWKEVELVKIAVDDYKYIMTHGDGKIFSTSEEPSELALRLARRAIFPFAPLFESQSVISESVSDATAISETARQLDAYIADSTRRDSVVFIDSIEQLRKVVTKLIADALVAHAQTKEPRRCSSTWKRSMTYREASPEEEDEEGIGDIEMESIMEPTRIPEVRDTAKGNARGRVKLVEAQQRAEQLWKEQCEIIKQTGFESQSDDIRSLVDRMLRIVGFNHTVFAPVYRMPGLLFGSGIGVDP